MDTGTVGLEGVGWVDTWGGGCDDWRSAGGSSDGSGRDGGSNGSGLVGVVPVDLGAVLGGVESDLILGTGSHASAGLDHKLLVIGRATNIAVGHGLPEVRRLGILRVVGVQGQSGLECAGGNTGAVGDEGEGRVENRSSGSRGDSGRDGGGRDCRGDSGGGGGDGTRRRSAALVGLVPELLGRVLLAVESEFISRAGAHAHTGLHHERRSVGGARLEGIGERLDEARSILINIVVLGETGLSDTLLKEDVSVCKN